MSSRDSREGWLVGYPTSRTESVPAMLGTHGLERLGRVVSFASTRFALSTGS